MKTSKKHSYEIKTSPLALSRIKKVLEEIDLSVLPEEKEDYGTFSVAIISELSSNEELFNEFFQSITASNSNFYAEEINVLEEIASDFFTKLGVSFKKLMLMKKKEIEKREDMVMKKMSELMTPKLKEIIENPKNITT